MRLATSLSIILIVLSTQSSGQVSWSKHPSNPVLSPGVYNGVSPYGIDGSFDSRYALSPSVIVDNKIYRMWYVGYESSWINEFTIGYSLSQDGVIWNTYTKNPVLAASVNGFDAQWVWLSVVVFSDEGLRMYYTGYDGARLTLGIAMSQDGVNWMKYASNPILSSGTPGSWDDDAVWGVSVVRLGPRDYRMWYSGRRAEPIMRIGYATSTDGIHWSKYSGNPILDPGPTGSWESQGVYVPRVVYANGLFHMFYHGTDPGTRAQIGYAYSSDGIQWTKYAGNPVLTFGQSGQWDSYALIDHCVAFEDSTFKIWYGGKQTTSGVWQIGYATSPLVSLAVLDRPTRPSEFRLYQSYPNPFNPEAEIRYDVPTRQQVSITVFNSLGQEVVKLLDEQKMPGRYSVTWTAKNVASGVYWYRMTAGEFVEIRKMMLLK